MEVLPRTLAASTTPQTQAPSAPSHAHLRISAPSLPIPSFLRPAALAASIVSSSSSLLAFGSPSLALNYDDFVKNVDSATSAASSSLPDASSFIDFDAATDFMTTNPVALFAGVAAVAVPLVASRAFAGPQSFGSISAVDAYDKLSDSEQNAQILDIRAPEDIKAEGTPDLKSLRKKVVQVPYRAEDDKFADKVLAKYRDAENTTLYILDRFDGSATEAAKLIANSGFKGAFAIKGGAGGQNGWLKNELPWSLPKKAFNFNIDGLKSIVGDVPTIPSVGTVDTSSLLPTTLGVAAAAGVGLVVFSEAETALQIVGSAALMQLLVKKFLFAEDRKKTFKDIQTFLDTKIAPKEFVDELKEVGRVLIPKDDEVQAAVATGAAELEKKLEVGSVTPEALAGTAADKLGIEIPDEGAAQPSTTSVVADAEPVTPFFQSEASGST